MPPQERAPACPVTGRPAVRHVQWVTARLLTDLWRIEFKTDARPSFRGIERFGLWESPAGLYFFDPPLEGDRAFYTEFYSTLNDKKFFSHETTRPEFLVAARRIEAGARVLDVGCGFASFRSCVPRARYTGLDPHFAEGSASDGVCNETLAQHLIEHAGSYDAVCAFQVLEHVKAPATLFAQIAQAVKPGGLIFVGVPHVPSALTRIPNFLLNAPPHHLTWWTRSALTELANGANAVVDGIEHVPWGGHDSDHILDRALHPGHMHLGAFSRCVVLARRRRVRPARRPFCSPVTWHSGDQGRGRGTAIDGATGKRCDLSHAGSFRWRAPRPR